MIIPKDTIIKVNGFPFKLTQDIEVDSNEENLKLALDSENAPSGSCCENP